MAPSDRSYSWFLVSEGEGGAADNTQSTFDIHQAPGTKDNHGGVILCREEDDKIQ